MEWVQGYGMGTRLWNGHKAMEWLIYKTMKWVQGYEMGTRLWKGYKAMEWVQGYGMGTIKR